MDNLRYFKNIGIVLDRKTLNIKINNGKQYKGYLFYYKKKLIYLIYHVSDKFIILSNFLLIYLLLQL